MKSHRTARVAEVIREVAAETILFQMKDPRVKNVTVTRAEVAADLMSAKIYVSIMGSEKAQKLAMHGLANAAGFVQRQLGDRLKMRFVPMVSFVLDDGVKKSLEIARILREEKARRGELEVAEPVEDLENEELEADDMDEGPEDAEETKPVRRKANRAGIQARQEQ
jgi:ribosome-binding factor A